MTRDYMISRIEELHEQARATDYGPLLIDRDRLAKHLAAQPDSTLSLIKRFYEQVLEMAKE